MSKLHAKGWMVLPIAALVLAALGGIFLARGDLASGSDTATVRIGSGQGAQSTEVTVPLEALGLTQPPLGAITVDIVYDDSLEPTGWNDDGSPLDMVQCSLDYAPYTVRCTGIDAAGVSGDIVVANITFHLIGPPGECDPLDVQIVTFADPEGNPIPATDQDGEICIGGSPTPTATVRIGSGEGCPSESVTVPLEVLDVPEPGLGAITVNIVYDDSVEPTAWDDTGSTLDMVQCSLDYAPYTIRCTGIDAAGVPGDVLVANITFHILGPACECNPLDVQIETFADPDGNSIDATDEDGAICIPQECCNGATVRIGSGEGCPSESVTVPLEVLDVPEPGLGAITVNIVYDDSVEPTAWDDTGSTLDMVQCSLDYAPYTIRCTGIDAAGVPGDVLVANITFHILGPACECNPLDVQIETFADPDGNSIDATDEDGAICIPQECCNGATVRIGSGEGDQSTEVTVPLEVLGLTQPPLGAITVNIVYDDSLEPTSVNENPSGDFDMVTCNLDAAPNTIRCTGIDAAGVSGDVLVANLTFHLVGQTPCVEECDPLDVQIVTFTDPDGNPIQATDEDGEICITCPPTCEVTVAIGSGEVPPGGTVTVPLEVLDVCEPGLGSYVIDVSYDDSIVQPVACLPDPDGVIQSPYCSEDFAPGVVCCGGFQAEDGLTGQVALCDITFQGIGEICQTSPLTLSVEELSLTNLSDPAVILEDGSIHVGPECGDVDCNGAAQMKDAMMIAQHIMGLRCGGEVCDEPGPDQCIYLPAADVDCNGLEQMLDAMLVAQCVMGLIDCDCNCCWPCD